MLHLITGANGAGKSLRAIWRMDERHKAGMEVYAYGFRNLRIPWVHRFDDPAEWRKLPPNAVLFIDEAQKVWRKQAGGKVPPEVEDLEEHRAEGIDIFLVTLSPKFINHHMHELISTHEHLVAYSKTSSRIFKFNECRTNTKSMDVRAKAGFEVWDHPQHMYDWYDSAEVHTEKPKVPWRQRINKLFYVVAALLMVWVAWSLYSWLTGDNGVSAAGKKTSAAESKSLASMFGGGGRSEKKSYANADEYLRAHKARVPEMPWSMPALDDEEPKVEPELFCMASGDDWERTCHCQTEQGTRYLMPQADCESMARWGPAYNPFKKPAGDRSLASNRDGGDGGDGPDKALRIMHIMLNTMHYCWHLLRLWLDRRGKPAGPTSRRGYELHRPAGNAGCRSACTVELPESWHGWRLSRGGRYLDIEHTSVRTAHVRG